MEFTKGGFDEFREDVINALADVAKKHDVKIELGNISYTAFEFDMKIHVTKGAEEDSEFSKAKFEHECLYYGFKPEDYNKEIILNGEKFKFVGFNMKARKNVCKILSIKDGKVYVCNSITVHRALDK